MRRAARRAPARPPGHGRGRRMVEIHAHRLQSTKGCSPTAPPVRGTPHRAHRATWQDVRVSADDVIALPRAFSGQRLDWRDLPRHVRTRIAELAGAQVTAEISATSGFSPGFAAVLEIADGRGVFVKAVSGEQNPVSPDLARAEIRVSRALPPQVPAPNLLWSSDDGDWVILGFDVVHGRSPSCPGSPRTCAPWPTRGSARRRRAAARAHPAAHRRPAGRGLHRLAQAARPRRRDQARVRGPRR